MSEQGRLFMVGQSQKQPDGSPADAEKKDDGQYANEITQYLRLLSYCLVAGNTGPLDDYVSFAPDNTRPSVVISRQGLNDGVDMLRYIKTYGGLSPETVKAVGRYVDYFIERIQTHAASSGIMLSPSNKLTSTVTTDDLQRDPLRYLQQVEAGETLIISKFDRPIAELKPVDDNHKLRPFGLCAGEFVVPDDFDDPLPENLLTAFEGQ